MDLNRALQAADLAQSHENTHATSVHEPDTSIYLQELRHCEAWRTTAQALIELIDSHQALVQHEEENKSLSSETRVEQELGHAETVSGLEEGSAICQAQAQAQIRTQLENLGLRSFQDLDAALERVKSVLILLNEASELQNPGNDAGSVSDDLDVEHALPQNPIRRSQSQSQGGHPSRQVVVSSYGAWSGTGSSFSNTPGVFTASTQYSSHSGRSLLSPLSHMSDYQMPTGSTSSSIQAHNRTAPRGFLPETLDIDHPLPHSEPRKLEPSMFKKRKRPTQFFSIGKVFWMLWTEPSDDANRPRSECSAEFFPGRNGELYYSKYRLFVVVRESRNYCNVVPIMSYGNTGVTLQKLVKREHGVVYTGNVFPEPSLAEEGMQPIPIRVKPDDHIDRLWPMSRINYGKQQSVEHNVKVKCFGTVDKRDRAHLVLQACKQWYSAETVGS